ncbi:MAG: outer membrane lipoprotein carrier protein LolA [Paludibacteraceae bacterium]|nr:outer membrane lipoprotein carrier protein LolA [Paludibacteraceae bacterium]
MKLLFITLTVLQSLLATLEQKTLVSDFSLSIADQQTQPMTYTGDLAMHGKQFRLSMFSMDAAYDGNTLYTYSDDVEELTLSTPTEEELVQTNPFLYAQALLPVCKYAENAVGDKTQITLTPNSPVNNMAVITKFILRVTTASLLPNTVEIHEDGGKVTTLRLTNAHYTDETPSFTIEKEGAFINDLR